MKTILFLLCGASLFFASCKPKTGSISGNVYWKYNKVQGDKPDAGSEVLAINLGDTATRYTSTCDVQGNFAIENVRIGNYLVLVRSKNTNDGAYDYLRTLAIYSKPLKQVTGFDLSKYKATDQADMVSVDSIYSAVLGQSPRSTDYGVLTRIIKMSDSLNIVRNTIATRLAEDLPENVKYLTGPPILYKVSFNEVAVKDGEKSTIVVDNGITNH